jgi:hypothetical protein
MNILFIDDTEQMEKRYVGMGGVIFNDNSIPNLFSMFTHAKESHSIPASEEIKWSPRKGSWIFENLRGEKRIAAYSAILNLIRLFGGKIITAVMYRYMTSYNVREAKWKCIEFVTERFQMFLQSQEDKNGIIIADFPGSGTEEKKLLSDYYQLLDSGTRYIKPSNLVMNILTTESHLNPGLQIADLVVGITTSMCTSHNAYASNFWHIVKESLHQSAGGIVIGCGIKIFPRETAEDIYARLFPQYFEEEGLEEERERMRRLYSLIMSEDELDLHFPRH